MTYRITQCYLPTDRGENPTLRLPSAKAGIRFSDHGGMQGWVDLCYMKADRPRIEPATCKLQVQRPTAEPPRNSGHSSSALSFSLRHQYSAVPQICKMLHYICTVKRPTIFNCSFVFTRNFRIVTWLRNRFRRKSPAEPRQNSSRQDGENQKQKAISDEIGEPSTDRRESQFADNLTRSKHGVVRCLDTRWRLTWTLHH